MRGSKWLSRKFLMAVGAILADIAIGLGYNVDPLLVAEIAGAIAGLYILVEGIIDMIKKG